MINDNFWNINRLFALLLKNEDNDSKSFDNDHRLFFKIKDFNALINNKLYFDQHIKKLSVFGKQCKSNKYGYRWS